MRDPDTLRPGPTLHTVDNELQLYGHTRPSAIP